MRLAHAADIHLDSPLRGLQRLGDGETADRLRHATRRAFENLVRLVLTEDVSLLVLAGDLYDGDWNDYSTGRFITDQLGRLHDAGVPVVMVSGNHDAQSEITRSLRLPSTARMLSVDRPESVVFDDLGVVVHGQGFATRAVQQNLAEAYPDRFPGLVNIGVLHTSVAGQEGHERYAPCSLPDLLAKGYEYFALGHVHSRATLAGGAHTVAYSGNLQGRHIRESGPKGALLVDLAPGEDAAVQFRELDVARWHQVAVDVRGDDRRDEVLDRIEAELRGVAAGAAGRSAVARVTVRGQGQLAAELADDVWLHEEADRIGQRMGVVLEKVRSEVRPDQPAGSVEDGLLAEIRSIAGAWTAQGRPGKAALKSLDNEIGRQLREAGLIDLADLDTLNGLINRAVDVLVARTAEVSR